MAVTFPEDESITSFSTRPNLSRKGVLPITTAVYPLPDPSLCWVEAVCQLPRVPFEFNFA
ncbi:hypothetical protein COY59_01700 [Candidatus Gottesmanbacteria bacterium CG_4_10_14_0_8_um_filter_37_24]|uniref:Uncharacterized protein n=1 Tax=Candidatus Gottesmanbacteria bacterium CG_4_10_14_0_8_um_filter_37_24 TaxID=1974574 RepID=A0A2M7RRT8_9BACT|nr:MAG: hypothetical protein COY59_01700 [Candidatus Gottesmanbacteria bacterium CG_4_10_14_0_8_um_filter_37_24]